MSVTVQLSALREANTAPISSTSHDHYIRIVVKGSEKT
jgi:tRNA G26 N,N-dimethylase Trm1